MISSKNLVSGLPNLDKCQSEFRKCKEIGQAENTQIRVAISTVFQVVREDLLVPVLRIYKAKDIGSSAQSFLPCPNLGPISLETLLRALKWSFEAPFLILNIRFFDFVEDWYHSMTGFLSAMYDLPEFLQAPGGVGVVLREDDNRHLRLLNPVKENREVLSSEEFSIGESIDSFPTEGLEEVRGEGITGVAASEAHKNVVLALRG